MNRNIAVHPVARLRERLQETVAGGETDRLKEFLLGLNLPALGGQQEPVDILLQAVHYPSYKSDLAHGLAELLGKVLSGESLIAEVQGSREALEDDLKDLVFNALALASQLPASATLFEALQGMAPLLEDKSFDTSDNPSLDALLRRALIYQQTDDSLESQWLGMISDLGRASARGKLSDRERTLLLDAWRGLLWIPPNGDQRESGSVINFEQLDKGLVQVTSTLTRREGCEQAIRSLNDIFQILSDSFPRSPDFWGRHLKPFFGEWAKELQAAAANQWPELGPNQPAEMRRLETKEDDGLRVVFEWEGEQLTFTGTITRNTVKFQGVRDLLLKLATVYHVARHEEGWKVEVEGTSYPTSVHGTKAEAVSAAKELAKGRSPGEVIVHKKDGKIQRRLSFDVHRS